MTEEQFQELRSRVIKKLEIQLDPRLTYHNPGHTKDILAQVERIARSEGISDRQDLLLLRISALFHDTGFLLVYADHEKASCEVLTEYMAEYDMDEREIEKMKGMIMATRIPQTPKNKLEEIICDADLDYLGRDDFEPISNGLMKEFLAYGVIRSETDWDNLQIRFFENHNYFTETCRSERDPKKSKHLQLLKQKKML
jgi:uncharacterized protein